MFVCGYVRAEGYFMLCICKNLNCYSSDQNAMQLSSTSIFYLYPSISLKSVQSFACFLPPASLLDTRSRAFF